MDFTYMYNKVFKIDDEYNSVVTSLISYIQGAQNKQYSGAKNLLELIIMAKTLKKGRKKHKYPFLENYLVLIENILPLIDDNSLKNKIIDDFTLAQLYLTNFLSKSLKMYLNNTPIQNENEVLGDINKFIGDYYGKTYFDILDFIYRDKNKEKEENISYIKLIDKAYDIIINFHPIKLQETLNAFCLKDNNKFFIDNFDYKASFDLKQLRINIEKASKDLIVLDRMKNYDNVSRYAFFYEFKNHNEYLDSVNSILKKNKKIIFSSLDSEPEDIQYLKEKIQFISEKGKKNEMKIKELKKNLTKTEKDNKILIEDAKNVYNKLCYYEAKKNDGKLIKLCERFEEYFFYSINNSTKIEIMSTIYSNNAEKKIDLIIKAIEKQYPKYIKTLASKGINLILLIKSINQFRVDKDKMNQVKGNKPHLMSTLFCYFEKKKLDIKNSLTYILKNFAELQDYIFDESYSLKSDLCKYFTKKEEELK